MIIFRKGDIFKSECQTLVNTVNCVGVMGKGIALQFKNKYPEMFEDYKLACKNKELKQGGDLWVWDYIDMYKPKKVLCFATKEHWKNVSKLEWIERGLANFTKKLKKKKYAYEEMGIKTIAFPKLGCTNGKLNWEKDVKPLMIKYLDPINLLCEIYE